MYTQRRDWSAWIDTIETQFSQILWKRLNLPVGIDLPELFKRKFLVMPE